MFEKFVESPEVEKDALLLGVTCRGDVELFELLKNAHEDTTCLEAYYSSLNSADKISFYEKCVREYFSHEYIETWFFQNTDLPFSALCYGSSLVDKAWEVRGGGAADTVSDDEFRVFNEYLDEARDILIHASFLAEDDPTALANLVTVGMGLQDRGLVDEAFEGAVERDPYNWRAHYNKLNAISRKWGGTHEGMFDFVMDVAIDLPEGTHLPLLLVEADMIYHEYLSVFEDEPDEAMAFIDDEVVRENVLFSYQQSLLSPLYVPNYDTLYMRYLMCSWFYFVDDKYNLQRELLSLGDFAREEFWDRMGFSSDFQDVKAFAFLD